MGGERERPRFPEGVSSRSTKSIEITFEFRGVRCRETIRLSPTPANIKRVAQHRAAVLDAIARGTFDYATTFPQSKRRFQFAEFKGAGYLLKDYLTDWIERQKKRLKASTYADYNRTIKKHLIPTFGAIALTDLKIPDVRSWAEGQEVKLKTVLNRLGTLRAALQDAVNDELIPSSPISDWRYERIEPPREEDDVDPFSAKEIQAILAACRYDQYKNLFRFAFWTGMRTSELVALEWGDIDFLNNKLRVVRAKTRASKAPEIPKTRKSVRTIDLLPPALEALEQQKAWTFIVGKRVFHNPIKNTPWTNDQKMRLAWVDTLKAAGVRYRNPYQTRHTFASMMLSAGENPRWLATQLGHSGLQMLDRTYGRWIPSTASNAGQKAVDLFSKSCGPNVAQRGQSAHILGHKRKRATK